MDDINKMEKEFKIKALVSELQNQLEDLKKENYALRKTLVEYGIEEESSIDEVEYICVKGIEDIKVIAEGRGLEHEDVKNLDILHKNLRICRKIEVKEPKGKAKSVAELLSIVGDGKEKKWIIKLETGLFINLHGKFSR